MEFFHSWINKINPFYLETDRDIRNYFEYPSEYQTLIELRKYAIDGKRNYTWKLYDAFPIYVSPIQAAWAEADTPVRFSVTIAYYAWSANKEK